MIRQSSKALQMLHVISTCILIIGILGITFNLIVTPEQFPTVSLFIAATGAILAVAISIKFQTWWYHDS